MSKKIQGWKLYPNHLRDEELTRHIMSDPDCTPLERNLALRLEKLCYKCDDLEMDVRNASHDNRNWTQMELF